MRGCLAELAALIERHASAAVSECALPRVTLVRAEDPQDVKGELLVPVVCLVVQGMKHVQLGAQSMTFAAGTLVVSALDFPITGHIVDAPYRAVAVHLTPQPLAGLLADEEPANGGGESPTFLVEQACDDLVEAMTRLLRLLDHTQDRATLGEAAEREVLYRALQTSSGQVIRRFAREGHLTSRVGSAIAWIREHAAERLSVEELAHRSHLSTSTLFYRHFRAATDSTPLQFQKQIRLQEARKLLLLRETNASGAAARVGYASAAQFNREYVRLFGRTPGEEASGTTMRRSSNALI